MSLERAQLEWDIREPRFDAVRENHRDKIEALLSDLNSEVQALCDLDDIPCDIVGFGEFMQLATGSGLWKAN